MNLPVSAGLLDMPIKRACSIELQALLFNLNIVGRNLKSNLFTNQDLFGDDLVFSLNPGEIDSFFDKFKA